MHRAISCTTRIEHAFEELGTFLTLMMSIWQKIKPRASGVLKADLTRGWTQKELVPTIRRIAAIMTLSCSHDHDEDGNKARRYTFEEKKEARRIQQVSRGEAKERYYTCFHDLLTVIRNDGKLLKETLVAYHKLVSQRDRAREHGSAELLASPAERPLVG